MTQNQRTNDALRTFLDSFQEAIGRDLGLSRATSEILYRAFCNHMLDRLLNHEEDPVPLIFANLHNCPYHPNWKAMAADKSRQGQFAGTTEEWLRHRLVSPHLLSVKSRPCCWLLPTIELELLPAWHAASEKVAEGRWRALGPLAYAKLVFTNLIARHDRFYRLYYAWKAAVARFIPGIVQDAPGGGYFLSQGSTAGGSAHAHRRILHHLAPALITLFPRRNGLFAKRPPRRLRRVPAVQPPPADLRNPGQVPP